MGEAVTKFCWDLVTDDVTCCDSCHEDYDDYGYAMCEYYDMGESKDEVWIVCCFVAKALEEQGRIEC